MVWRLGRELTDQKVRGSNPTLKYRLLLSRLGQPGGTSASVLPSHDISASAHKTVSVRDACGRAVTEHAPYNPKRGTGSCGAFYSIIVNNRSPATSFRHFVKKSFSCSTMPPEGCTRAGILSGYPSLDRGSRGAEVGFEPRIFRSDPSTVVELTYLSAPARFWLRTYGDSEAVPGTGTVLSPQTKWSLFKWSPVDSRLHAVRLAMPVKVSRKRTGNLCEFTLSAKSPNRVCDTLKGSFYGTLSTLLRLAKSSDIVTIIGSINAQVGRLDAAEAQLGSRPGLKSRRTDNGERVAVVH
ncbi:LOW QUALITY PROTEIN: hypothetical protein T265_15223 [Opisthorchis viverrini]|uniref:Uncharacterized protein n=1 Tax=Opisthorchis viverrini TaxID=6198 RepID=A0A075A0E6_OPIVI|nr:LOW QUALITY PROTEIN: hypothetical protein T265_15223 [Opisthorchis viverrini]KER20899.1 LOW QUALITY PROTEIN: hypothetical protein T265_15223 [Opisthorchis viverrini]